MSYIILAFSGFLKHVGFLIKFSRKYKLQKSFLFWIKISYQGVLDKFWEKICFYSGQNISEILKKNQAKLDKTKKAFIYAFP